MKQNGLGIMGIIIIIAVVLIVGAGAGAIFSVNRSVDRVNDKTDKEDQGHNLPRPLGIEPETDQNEIVFARARNTRRASNVMTILNAIQQRMAENRGVWNSVCGNATVTLPNTATNIGFGTGLINLEDCLVPNYIPGGMVIDPSIATVADTGYTISVSGGVITVAAPGAELGEVIQVIR